MRYSHLMRGLTLVFALTLVDPSPAFSQRVSLGFEGGFRNSSASVSVDGGDETTQAKADFRMGASLHLDLEGTVGIRVGMLYARKGFDQRFALFGTPLELTLHYAYLELPILAEFRVPVGGTTGVTPFFAVGPVVAIKLGCDVILRAGGQSEDATCANDADDVEVEASGLEVGVQFGGGVIVPTGAVSLMFEIAYNLGLTDVTVDPNDTVKHRGFLLTGGLIVPIGRRQ